MMKDESKVDKMGINKGILTSIKRYIYFTKFYGFSSPCK